MKTSGYSTEKKVEPVKTEKPAPAKTDKKAEASNG